jgi:nucleoside-triphosphatase THEP1
VPVKRAREVAGLLKVLNEALDREGPLLATIFARSLPFTEAIKSRPDVTLIEVHPDNRERLVSELSDRIRKLNPS